MPPMSWYCFGSSPPARRPRPGRDDEGRGFYSRGHRRDGGGKRRHECTVSEDLVSKLCASQAPCAVHARKLAAPRPHAATYFVVGARPEAKRKGLCSAQWPVYYLSKMQIDQKIGNQPSPPSACKIGIGSVALDGVVLLAPMSGITDVVMRRLGGPPRCRGRGERDDRFSRARAKRRGSEAQARGRRRIAAYRPDRRA